MMVVLPPDNAELRSDERELQEMKRRDLLAAVQVRQGVRRQARTMTR